MTHNGGLDTITRAISSSIAELFKEPEFDSDAGDVRFLDRDERCVWLGLFPTRETGEPEEGRPSVVWTIEVSRETTDSAG